jgi:hypothetical protein
VSMTHLCHDLVGVAYLPPTFVWDPAKQLPCAGRYCTSLRSYTLKWLQEISKRAHQNSAYWKQCNSGTEVMWCGKRAACVHRLDGTDSVTVRGGDKNIDHESTKQHQTVERHFTRNVLEILKVTERRELPTG